MTKKTAKPKLKEYSIGVWEEQSGYVHIEATSEEEAKKMVLQMVEEEGIDHLRDTLDLYIDITHRNVELV